MKNKELIIIIIIAIIISLIIMIASYYEANILKKQEEMQNAKFEQANSSIPEEKYVPLEELPQNYEANKQLEDGCVVITYKQVYNLENLEEFINNVNQNKTDWIRIIQGTTEGYEIITDVKLTQDGIIEYYIDNTRDEFSAQEDRKITKKEYSKEEYQITQEEDRNFKRVYIENKLGEVKSRNQICIFPFEVKNDIPFKLKYKQRKDLGIEKILEKDDNLKYDVYTFGGNIEITIQNETLPLEEAVRQNKITMENIIHQCILDSDPEYVQNPETECIMQKPQTHYYSDGGSVIYEYPEYSILKRFSLDGNRDIYIGMPGMILTGQEGNMVAYSR